MAMEASLKRLGLQELNPGVFDGSWRGGGSVVESVSPVDGRVIARVQEASDKDYERAVTGAEAAFLEWRVTPAPLRGELVRRLGNALRAQKDNLARLVTLEMGKIIAEAE